MPAILGSGDHRYRVVENWAKLPQGWTLSDVAAVAVDNPAVETLRVTKEEGFLHRLLIPLLGMPLGEFWNLEELARACRARSRHEFLFFSVPLKIPRGAGSPGNGLAIL